jgi:multidrug resistance efflux pump
MNTEATSRYETELDNLKRDLQRLMEEVETVIEQVDREDLDYAYERAYGHMLDKAGQATEQLKKVRRLDREVQEEREEAKAGN